MEQNQAPMPFDFNALAMRMGMEVLRNLQLEYQVRILSDEVTAMKAKNDVPASS